MKFKKYCGKCSTYLATKLKIRCNQFSSCNMIDEFSKCLQWINFFLKVLGLSPDTKDDQRTILQRLRCHPVYLFHFISLNYEVLAELMWLIHGLITHKSFLEITFNIPCLVLCLLSNFKTLSGLVYAQCVNDLLDRLEKLQLSLSPSVPERDDFVKTLVGEHVLQLKSILTKTLYMVIAAVALFVLTPIFVMLPQYYKTGEVELLFPFAMYYPYFDAYDMRFYPFVYLHQSIAGYEAVFFVFAPDCIFFTCCTFVNLQFLLLQYDMERVVDDYVKNADVAAFKLNFKKLTVRHVEVIRCVGLLETIYSKSILVNALTSSIIICVTGFNVLVNDNILTVASFMVFLGYSLMQIFLFCSYGDNIMRSSRQLSDAMYNSQWYNVDAKERRSFLIVIIRAQKACKLTAYGFFDINLNAFTSILSTSWSYFALLKTMYGRDGKL